MIKCFCRDWSSYTLIPDSESNTYRKFTKNSDTGVTQYSMTMSPCMVEVSVLSTVSSKTYVIEILPLVLY